MFSIVTDEGPISKDDSMYSPFCRGHLASGNCPGPSFRSNQIRVFGDSSVFGFHIPASICHVNRQFTLLFFPRQLLIPCFATFAISALSSDILQAGLFTLPSSSCRSNTAPTTLTSISREGALVYVTRGGDYIEPIQQSQCKSRGWTSCPMN